MNIKRAKAFFPKVTKPGKAKPIHGGKNDHSVRWNDVPAKFGPADARAALFRVAKIADAAASLAVSPAEKRRMLHHR